MKKDKVKLREKTLKDGTRSLYLDIYADGERRYEFLKLYLAPERTRADRMKNAETMRLAEIIRAQRTVDVERRRYDLGGGDKTTLAEYLATYKESLRTEGKATGILRTLINTIQRLCNITADTLQDIKAYIDGLPIAPNTKTIYFAKLRTALFKAVKEGRMRLDTVAAVKADTIRDTEREYLTMDEVRTLAKTPCRADGVKRAFLFSCLTGLRYVDVSRLTWADVRDGEGGTTRIMFTQQKTKKREWLDISEQAVELMGERGRDTDKVFDMRSRPNDYIPQWVEDAGITGKRITFHSARHTFAVMMLELGVNIAVIQKLLGHKSLATTMIYAKVVDKSKREAMGRIPQLL